MPPWRNGLACWTSNSKVVGSSPTGGVFFLFSVNFFIFFTVTILSSVLDKYWSSSFFASFWTSPRLGP